MGERIKHVTFIENSMNLIVDHFLNGRLLYTNEFHCTKSSFGDTIKVIFEGFTIDRVCQNKVTLIREIK